MLLYFFLFFYTPEYKDCKFGCLWLWGYWHNDPRRMHSLHRRTVCMPLRLQLKSAVCVGERTDMFQKPGENQPVWLSNHSHPIYQHQGIEPGTQLWKASAVSTELTGHPFIKKIYTKVLEVIQKLLGNFMPPTHTHTHYYEDI